MGKWQWVMIVLLLATASPGCGKKKSGEAKQEPAQTEPAQTEPAPVGEGGDPAAAAPTTPDPAPAPSPDKAAPASPEDAEVIKAAEAAIAKNAAPHTTTVERRDGDFALVVARHVEPITDPQRVFEDGPLFMKKSGGAWREIEGGCEGVKKAKAPAWMQKECDALP